MEDKIEVGEYVRTKDGRIDKIIAIHNEEDCTIVVCKKKYWKEDISKHSKQPIDLIEVGDYVNGKEVIEIKKINEKIYLMTDYCPQNYIKTDIKTILTKESYMANCYKVGVEDE